MRQLIDYTGCKEQNAYYKFLQYFVAYVKIYNSHSCSFINNNDMF